MAQAATMPIAVEAQPQAPTGSSAPSAPAAASGASGVTPAATPGITPAVTPPATQAPTPAAPSPAAGLVAFPADVANTTLAGNQSVRAVGTLAAGGHAVAWLSQDSAGQSLLVQRYEASGVKSGAETRVAYNVSAQESPAIAVLRDGSIIVASVDGRAAASDPSLVTWTVFARRFDANGAQVGTEAVMATLAENQSGAQARRYLGQATLAALEDGGFALGWASIDEDVRGRVQGWQVQRFDAQGQPAGARQSIAATDADSNLSLRLVPLPGGDFVAGTTHRWQGIGYVQFRIGGRDVGPRFDADAGLPEFNTTLLPLADGRFALWSLGRSGGYLQMLDAAGRPLSAAQSVTVVPETAVGLADGGWVTVQRQMPGDPFLAQRFDAAGRALGDRVEVASGMSRPLPASSVGNGLALAWTFTGAGGDSDVRTQRIDAR